MAASDFVTLDRPRQSDLDTCVHCGLCLNACPTYRELRVEMDSPRGRIYQMAQVASGAPISDSYIEHIGLCLACRGCETACPSGVRYGRLVEAARAEIENHIQRPWLAQRLRAFFFKRLLPSRINLGIAGTLLYLYQVSGLKWLVRVLGFLPSKLRDVESLAPEIEAPFFFSYYGKTLPAEGQRRYRVAFLGGCIANICFARLNEATVRVLQKNGCEVTTPEAQTCCGALHVHAGLAEDARALARKNIDAILAGDFDAIITNAAGCGSTLKEYGELLEHDPVYAEKARAFAGKMKDVTEFLASIGFNEDFASTDATATYQDSCHLSHGQKVRVAPRTLLGNIPGLELREMQVPDLCCGSAGIYNVMNTGMSLALLRKKMDAVNATGAQWIITANPGCMLQLTAGVRKFGRGQKVLHVVEALDRAYTAFKTGS
ncbi:MAG TPA: heterodisulfide reductase-related iron-sulfur binding cluster [Bryobacteraceae bacterium]|nr:heterodisulfide reductase-related iron-sulfur binding cluster [Bryobacteraceae bacterium]